MWAAESACLDLTALREVGPAGSQSSQASGVSITAVSMADGKKEIIGKING